MNRLPEDFIKLFDGSSPESSSFSMILADTKQKALEDWVDKRGFDALHVNMNCVRAIKKEGNDYTEVLYYRGNPVLQIIWNPKTQKIMVHELE